MPNAETKTGTQKGTAFEEQFQEMQREVVHDRVFPVLGLACLLDDGLQLLQFLGCQLAVFGFHECCNGVCQRSLEEGAEYALQG
jgi:hypothetical protein